MASESQEVAPASPVTLGEALAEYINTLKAEQRRTHEFYVRKYVEHHGDGHLVMMITSSRVESYAEAQIRSSDPNAPERVAALKAWFQFLKKREYTPANLGVHIRVRKSGMRAGSLGLRPEEAPIEMTAEGLETLKREREVLTEQRPALVQAIEIARSDGDLRENAPYHAAREALAFAEQRARQVDNALKRAIIVERDNEDRTSVGSTVTVLDLDDEREQKYILVSAREANAAERKISVESPVGKQLLNRRVGEEVVVATPRGEKRYRIERIGS
ncbi:MAG: transcription elongation factor GreA [Dehalococcoidia bacterium]